MNDEASKSKPCITRCNIFDVRLIWFLLASEPSSSTAPNKALRNKNYGYFQPWVQILHNLKRHRAMAQKTMPMFPHLLLSMNGTAVLVI
jgi:hypothetical protein